MSLVKCSLQMPTTKEGLQGSVSSNSLTESDRALLLDIVGFVDERHIKAIATMQLIEGQAQTEVFSPVLRKYRQIKSVWGSEEADENNGDLVKKVDLFARALQVLNAKKMSPIELGSLFEIARSRSQLKSEKIVPMFYHMIEQGDMIWNLEFEATGDLLAVLESNNQTHSTQD